MSTFVQVMENKSKKFFNGSIWITNRFGEVVVIARLNKRYKKSFPYYLCMFEDGTIVEARDSSLINGSVRNPNAPTYCNVGVLGQGGWKSSMDGEFTKEYKIWIGMIGRCYGKDPYYKDVIVDHRWHNFQNFCEDILEINGYDEWARNPLNYSLDKDILCDKLNLKNKIYSKETCVFITRGENTAYSFRKSNITGLTYVAKRISDGYTEEFINQREFARKWNLNGSAIIKVLKGRQKHHKGWVFKTK